MRWLVDRRWAQLLPGMVCCLTLARAEVFPRSEIIVEPTPAMFNVCHGNGCRDLSFVSLNPVQWQDVLRIFHPLAPTPAEERERLRAAIALMEKFVGAANGTWRDKGGTFNPGEGQMDCIDESTNTTLYLTMFERYGLMRLHRVEDRATRGWFIGGWPHASAVIGEAGDFRGGKPRALWAVDSWFLDNGQPPFIIPLETWKAGWQPDRW